MKKCLLFEKCKFKKGCKKEPFAGNKLCPGYEEYVSQDAKLDKGAKFEIPFSCIGFDVTQVYEERTVFVGGDMNKWNAIVKFFFFDRVKVSEIADKAGCSEQFVYRVIAKCRSLLLNYHTIKKEMKNAARTNNKTRCVAVKKRRGASGDKKGRGQRLGDQPKKADKRR